MESDSFLADDPVNMSVGIDEIMSFSIPANFPQGSSGRTFGCMEDDIIGAGPEGTFPISRAVITGDLHSRCLFTRKGWKQ